MTQREFLAAGAAGHLAEVLDELHCRSVFVVAGRRSYQNSGAAAALAPALHARQARLFTDFDVNPKLAHVRQGVAAFRAARPDTIVAVGGGSALDMAKLINCFAANREQADRVLAAADIQRRGVPLIAMPTTAGSGSEATPFAVVYDGFTKHSVDHPSLLPDVTIVDPALTRSMPPYMTAVTGLDALSQAVESYWSVGSTEASRALAARAVTLIRNTLPASVHAPTDEARRSMAEAANLAGKAIAVTRTTGPHALSYALTAHHGVPHGHAVALFLPSFFRYNLAVSDADCADPRGPVHVRNVVTELCGLLGVPATGDVHLAVQRFVGSLGVATAFAAVGVTPEALAALLDEVNHERLRNNPRAFDRARFMELLAGTGTADLAIPRPRARGTA